MSCPFYGRHASISFGDLVATNGNQCAIIVRAISPCVMETSLGMAPDAATCELLSAARMLREVYAHYATAGRELLKQTVAKELFAEFEKMRAEKPEGG